MGNKNFSFIHFQKMAILAEIAGKSYLKGDSGRGRREGHMHLEATNVPENKVLVKCDGGS